MYVEISRLGEANTEPSTVSYTILNKSRILFNKIILTHSAINCQLTKLVFIGNMTNVN